MADSNYLSILNAAQSVVANLGLIDWHGVAVPSAVAKLPRSEESLDSLPLIVVCPGGEPEEVEPRRMFGGYVIVSYPVDVVIIAAGNQDFASHLDYYLSWREKIRQAFQGPTLSGTAVFDTRMHPQVPIDRGLVNQNYDYSGIRVQFFIVEQRDAS